MNNTRRSFLKWSGLSGLGLGLSPTLATNKPTSTLSVDSFSKSIADVHHRFPTMVHEYYVAKVKESDKRHSQRIYGLQSKEDALAYQAEIRWKLKDCLGPLPDKTPLNPTISGELQRDNYRIEKIIFESQPGFKVTANFYINETSKNPKPTILGVCGHTREAKASSYQIFAQALVKKGYHVLLMDPIGQGERLQYPDENNQSKIGFGVKEHQHCGIPLVLVGQSLSQYFVWDTIRAIDYLMTRPEVDPLQIGITGNSGGGTQTALLCAIEDRLSMAAPSCYITTLRRNIENTEVQDAEQCPPRILFHGMDHFDMIAAMAPKPVLLISQEKDFFDVRGTEECYRKLQHFYGLLGAKDNISLFVGDGYHGYHQDGREAMYGFFNQVTGMESSKTEPTIELEKEADLWCTKSGQLQKHESLIVHDLLSIQAAKLSEERHRTHHLLLPSKIREILQLPNIIPSPDYRILRGRKENNFPQSFVSDFLLETEKGIQISLYRLGEAYRYSRPPLKEDKIALYVSHQSIDQELQENTVLHDWISQHPDYTLYACDLRGIGQSKPNTRIPEKHPFQSEFLYADIGNMYHEPLIGKRTYDLLSVFQFFEAHQPEECILFANGWGCLPATFAVCLNQKINKIYLQNCLTSYTDIVQTWQYHWPLSAFPPSVLQSFDLPDCYALLKSQQRLQILNTWSAMADQ